MRTWRSHILNALIAAVLALVWVAVAGGMAWGAFSEHESTRYTARALASPYALAKMLLPEWAVIPGAMAIMFAACFAVVSLFGRVIRRKHAHET